jgi:hypothetical protein
LGRRVSASSSAKSSGLELKQ